MVVLNTRKILALWTFGLFVGMFSPAQSEIASTFNYLIDVFKTIDPFAPLRLDEFQLGSRYIQKDHIALVEPFILFEDDGRTRVSSFLKGEQETLLRMNDLSYKLVRNVGNQIQMTAQELDQLRVQGWIIKGFSGLEGRRNTYPDLSGMVCYHPVYNLMVVVYRGTAGNKDGWDTNFDATKINAQKIQKEFSRDLFDEVLDQIRQSDKQVELREIKKIIRSAQKDEPGYKKAKDTYVAVKAKARAKKIPEDLTADIFKTFDQKLGLMDDVEMLGYDIEGDVHKGFLKKYLSTKQEVLEIIKTHVAQMKPEKKSKLKIVFTGHSQAGATGCIALADICGNHGKELFGGRFDNKKAFRFYGYFLSAARAGDKEYKKWVHEKVGKEFIIRQNVDGDPAPVSAADEKIGDLVYKIPVVGELLAKRLTQYDDTGYLLLDDGHKVWKRAREMYERDGVDMSKFEETEDLVRYAASWVITNEKDIPKFLAPRKESTSFWWSPITWTRNRINTAKTINLIRRALMGDQEAIKGLESFSQDIITRYAHLHYGHVRPGTGASFDPEVVGRELDVMAQRGHKHEYEPKKVKD